MRCCRTPLLMRCPPLPLAANNQWKLDEEIAVNLEETSFRKAMALSRGTVTVLDQGGETYMTCRPLGARRQARPQRNRRGGRQGDRRRAQGLSAVYAEVRLSLIHISEPTRPY